MENKDSVNLLRSVLGGSEASTKALQLQYYVDELRRQSAIASRSLTRGWTRAIQDGTASNDAEVWGDLQSALFASIVISRTLKPVGVRKNKAAAEQRGQELRELLRIDESSDLFRVNEIRNSFEHFDERLDSVFVDMRGSLVDWHISKDGVRLRTPQDSDGPVGEALRQFFPGSGTLHFGDDTLDLFALDRALLVLVEDATSASKQLARLFVGPYTYGVFKHELFDQPEVATARVRDWFRFRAEIGNAVVL